MKKSFLYIMLITQIISIQTEPQDLSQSPKTCILTPSQQLELANRYYNGDRLGQDYEAAHYFYGLAANQTDDLTSAAEATLMLGKIAAKNALTQGKSYLVKNGIKRDEDKSLPYLEQAANQQDDPSIAAEANMLLGDIYCKDSDDSVIVEIEESEEIREAKALEWQAWMKRSIRHRKEQINEFNRKHYSIYHSPRNSKRAVKYWERAATQQVNYTIAADACIKLGDFYYLEKTKNDLGNTSLDTTNNNETLEDYAKALSYFMQAAQIERNAGLLSTAHLRLAEIYHLGLGVPKDYAKACYYLELITNQKDINEYVSEDAKVLLGEIYYLGEYGVKQDYEKAYSYFKDALKDKEDPRFSSFALKRARWRLGHMHYRGHGTAQDYHLAQAYFEMALGSPNCLNTNMDANFWLAEMYYLGQASTETVERDFDPNPRYRVPVCINERICINTMVKDYKKALTHYNAVNWEGSNDPVTLATIRLRLGQIYYEGGHGVAKDYTLARQYFLQAAEQQDDIEVSNEAKKILAYWMVPQEYLLEVQQ